MAIKRLLVVLVLVLHVNLYSLDSTKIKNNIASFIDTVVFQIKNMGTTFNKAKSFFSGLQKQITVALNSFAGSSSSKIEAIQAFLSNVLGKIKSLI